MILKTQYIPCNAVERVPRCSSWPPPWLSNPSETLPETREIPAISADITPQIPASAIIDEETGFTAIPVESVDPCPVCGSLELWWDAFDNVHCQHCRPIRRALALADLAARIRNRKK